MRFKLLNHWFIDNNKIGISLMRFYIDIEILIEDGELCYKLQIFDDNKVALTFIFETFENVMTFVEDVVNKNSSITLLDIKKTYDEEYGKSKIIIKNRYNN